MQELLDEIERNMQRTNGRLDDALLNKLAKQLDKRSRLEHLRPKYIRETSVVTWCNDTAWRVMLIDVHCTPNVSIGAHLPPRAGK